MLGEGAEDTCDMETERRLGGCHRKGRGARRQGREGTDGSTKILCFKMP